VRLLTIGAGVAVGYVLGTRAGRAKYEQIVATTRRLRENPTTGPVVQAVQELISPPPAPSATAPAPQRPGPDASNETTTGPGPAGAKARPRRPRPAAQAATAATPRVSGTRVNATPQEG
jgi:hypothetical protein